jgi:hypothetical protein
MRPRQPDVPNVMGEEFGEGFMAMYSSPVIVKRKWTTVELGWKGTRCPKGNAE